MLSMINPDSLSRYDQTKFSSIGGGHAGASSHLRKSNDFYQHHNEGDDTMTNDVQKFAGKTQGNFYHA